MNDLISRKEAINIFINEGMPTAAVYIERMKPAQPKKKTVIFRPNADN